MNTSSGRDGCPPTSRGRNIFNALSIAAGIGAFLFGAVARAQPPARGATPPPVRAATVSPAPKVAANLQQLMRGILYPSSNVIFAAQDDLAKFPVAAEPSTSPNPLTSSYGGWEAVENAGLALAESANLLLLPGRVCSNGRPAPVRRADWVKYVQGLRQTGMAAYKAAQSKNQDAMIDLSGTLSDACAACHEVYREKKGGANDRCLP